MNEAVVRATPGSRQAEEWALVLEAAGVPHRLASEGHEWLVVVPDDELRRAQMALDAYENDARDDRPVAVAEQWPDTLPWTSGLVVALVLLAFFAVTGPPAASARWFARGAASAGMIRAGEPWRAVTALTLHLDAVHVTGNAVATVVLLPAVAQRFGVGLGLVLTLAAGVSANLLGALAHDPRHVSVGASTATFGAIGILAAVRMLPASPARQPQRKAWMVVAATVLLLAMLGASQGSDVLGHLLGVVTGAVLGLLAGVAVPRPPGTALQVPLVLGALFLVAGAWALALPELWSAPAARGGAPGA